MRKITVRLFVDTSPASDLAQTILRRKGVEFVTLPSSSSGLPAVQIGNQFHSGLAEIAKLADTFSTNREREEAGS